MNEAAIVVCTWLHLVVLVIWVGHMVNALILFGPLASKHVNQNSYGDFIADYRRRDRPVALGCIAIFLITGLFLTLLNEQYTGLGQVFSNSWSAVLFAKHILVLAMIVLGIYQGTRVMPKLAEAAKKATRKEDSRKDVSVESLEKVRLRVTQMLCALSMAVLLLTAIGETI